MIELEYLQCRICKSLCHPDLHYCISCGEILITQEEVDNFDAYDAYDAYEESEKQDNDIMAMLVARAGTKNVSNIATSFSPYTSSIQPYVSSGCLNPHWAKMEEEKDDKI